MMNTSISWEDPAGAAAEDKKTRELFQPADFASASDRTRNRVYPLSVGICVGLGADYLVE
jgi:hypothetical protein